VQYIENCETAPENYINDGINFICPKCKAGFYQNLQNGNCDPCSLPLPCLGCSDSTHCLACSPGKILNEDKTACISPIENCASAFEEYVIDPSTGRFKCSKCSDGFIWSDRACRPCELVIPTCTSCSQGKCDECAGVNRFPTYKKDGCMEPLRNCSDEFVPADYTVVNGKYVCTKCDEGYYWNYQWS